VSRQLQFLQYGNSLYATNMSWVGAAEEEDYNIVNEICPELVKLDKLDDQEKVARGKMLKGELDQELYQSVVSVLQSKRDKLITKLEKDGYFGEDSPPQGDFETEAVRRISLKDKWAGLGGGTRVVVGVSVFVLTCALIELAAFIN